MPLFKILFINILFIPAYLNSLSAQQYNIKFKHIGQQKGLSNDHITDILQDNLGYIWIATKRGLNRYDGNQMLNFQSEPISSAGIVDLEINVYGGIWILTKKELILYHEGATETKISFNNTKPQRNNRTSIAKGAGRSKGSGVTPGNLECISQLLCWTSNGSTWSKGSGVFYARSRKTYYRT